MKKFLLLLGMVTCIFGAAACGKAETEQTADLPQFNEEALINAADQMIDGMNQVLASGMKEQYAEDVTYSAGLTSWESALKELGEYQGITDHEVVIDADGAVIKAMVGGSERNAVVTLNVDTKGYLTGISADVEYSFGERMTNAALNTLMGMGTVFIVLVIMIGCISCFKFIPALQEKFSRKKKKAKAPDAEAAVQISAAAPMAAAAEPAAAPAQDEELVAVIAAAIAASEGYESTDGFVVRSIRRRGGSWRRG